MRVSVLLASILLSAAQVPAQVPPPVPGPSPIVPPTAAPLPTPAAPAPSMPAPGMPGAVPAALSPSGELLVPLQLLDVDIKDVLAMYEKWTGRRLIYSTQLVGPIRIFVSGQVPQTEAIKLVEMTLLMNGFNIIPTEDPKIWKVTGVGMNPKQVGIPFVDREDLLPPGEQTVMFLFKLTWADPTELAATIQSGILVPSQAGGSSVTPLPKAQSLLVTENTNIIRNLIRIVRAIDVEPAEVVSEFISLEHAEAEDVATHLEKLFEKQQTQQTTGLPGQPRVQRTVADQSGGPLPPGVPASDGNLSIQVTGGTSGLGPTEDNFVVGKVRITADKRTNRLHVVSRPVNLKLIRALIREYDSLVPLAAPAVRPLRFRPVEEVIDAIVSAIRDPGDKTAGGTGTGAAGGAAGGRPAQNPLQNQTSNRTTGTDRFGESSSSSSGTLGESLSTSERDTQPVAVQVGKSTIIADKRANSIIVVGAKDITEKIFAILDKLDTPQAQVMIHCIIGELTLTKNEQYGVEYLLKNGGLAFSSGTAGTVSPGLGFDSNGAATMNFNNLLSQSTITKALAAGSGGISGFVTSGNNLAVAVNALQSSDRFRVLERPSIFTTNNKRAIITSGTEVPIPTNIQAQFNNATTVTTNNLVSNSQIQYKPIELRLEVLPLINSDKDVSLEIVQNISEQSGTTTIDNNAIPNIARQAIKTYVTVPNNGTLILGGLIKESTDNAKTGVHTLSSIPIIGPLFGKTTKAKIRNELIIIMRPVVTVKASENIALREKTFEGFNIPTDMESAILPQNIRQKLNTGKPSSMRSSAPKLRDDGSQGRQ
jgi:type II secretion system protein D